MSFASWLRDLKDSVHKDANKRLRRPAKGRLAQRLFLELLEDRTLPSAYVVTTTSDTGPGSLRDAITQINLDASHTLYPSTADPTKDAIAFNIPTSDPGYQSGTQTFLIQPQLAVLPTITNAVIIDGYSQPGSSPNTLAVGDNAVLKIVLDGSVQIGAGLGGAGLVIAGTNCTVRGLAIDNFNNSVFILNSDDNVQGNFIGLDNTGSYASSGNGFYGIEVYSLSNGGAILIGGSTPDARNVIAGFAINIEIIVGPTVVQGNYVGTNAAGTAMPNGITSTEYYRLGFAGYGVESGSEGNTISANLISGNPGIGISLAGFDQGTIIQGNLIGTDSTGTNPIPNGWEGINSGGEGGIVYDGGPTPDLIGGTTPGAGNIIAYNVGSGVANGGLIEGNSIYGNTGLGIDEGLPNVNQFFPILTSATSSSSGTTITGTLQSVASTTFRVEFFANAAMDPSGYGQGQTYLGFATVSTDGSGNASFSATFTTEVPRGFFVSATATDLSAGNTSEFSKDLVVGCFLVTNTYDSGAGSLRAAIMDADTLDYGTASNPDQIQFDIPTTDPGYQNSANSFSIMPLSALPTITDTLVLDGYTQFGGKCQHPGHRR